jgi:hypothetical protein
MPRNTKSWGQQIIAGRADQPVFLGQPVAIAYRGIRLRWALLASLLMLGVGFYAGQIYNAARQVESVLPSDTSVVRDLGYVAPAEYRLEVGML